jgi:hypothetical protein
MLQEDIAMANAIYVMSTTPLLFSILNNQWESPLWGVFGPMYKRFLKCFEVSKTPQICLQIAREAGIIA